MRRSFLALAVLLAVSISGCPNNDDLTDTITRGAWKMGYVIQGNDEQTNLFYGYVFTFQTSGTVIVARPAEPTATGHWNEYNNDSRLTLDFGKSGLLERLNKDWFVDYVRDNEIALHEPGAPFNQVRFDRL